MTSAAREHYDVVVVGSGIGGSVVAAHLVRDGVNPRSGEPLRVALLEAGPHWQGETRPGYGAATRRRRIANVVTDDAADRMWPWGMVKMVGGSTNHYGASVYLPYDVDYAEWVAEGTDWTKQACRDAADEVQRMFNPHTEPDELLARGSLLFRDAARALGRDVQQAQVARRNCLYCGFCEAGYFCRYDSKSNALTTYIPEALKHGVEIVPEAPVERVVIEKKGARQVATGVVYRDGLTSRRIGADKIVVSAGVVGSPLLLSRSGCDNPNIGKHLDNHPAIVVGAYFDEDIKDESLGSAPAGYFFLDDDGPDAKGRVRVKDSGMGIDEPWKAAFSPFAPEFGREHKQFMRHSGRRIAGALVVLKKPEGYRGAIDLRNGEMEYRGNASIARRLRRGGELARAVLEKMGAKGIVGDDSSPLFHIGHGIGTCRAGSDPKTSVVTPDFESHDVENLFVCDASVLPRSCSGDAVGPIATVSALAGQRIVENHFRSSRSG